MRPFFILSLCVLIAACKKTKDETQAYKNARYTFTNHLNQPITVKIFTDSGWSNSSSVYLHIAPGKKGLVPPSMYYVTGSIPTRLQYFWTTDDKQFSNWGFRPLSKFNYDPAIPVRNFDINGVDGDGRMLLFLKHLDSNTTWKAIDAYDATGASIWNSIPANNRNYTIMFNCFSGAIINYYLNEPLAGDGFGYTITNNSGYYDMQNEDYDAGQVLVPKGHLLFTNKYAVAGLVSNTQDRAYLIIDNKPPYYLMAKQ